MQTLYWRPISYAVYCFGGFNIPVSEDLMIFVSALLAAENGIYSHLFVGIWSLSDHKLTEYFGPKLLQIKFFSSMASAERIEKISHYYENYGVITLLLGRFIPFGVRNGLFMTAGLSKMNPVKFALADLVAATISVTTFFYLYYSYGESVVALVKQFNVVIFTLALIFVLCYWFFKGRKKSIS